MPSQIQNKKSRSKANTARQLLLTGHAPLQTNEDDQHSSDDDNHDWEWVYEDYEVANKDDDDQSQQSRKRKRKVSAVAAESNLQGKRIVAARKGKLEVRVGDAVALKADRNEVWVAIITELVDDEDIEQDEDEGAGKCARFMWLSSPKEIYNKEKRRNDVMPQELYATTSTDENPLDTIMGKATICSPGVFFEKHPSGKIPKKSPDQNRLFICRRGANLRTATYTSEFVWENIFHGEEDIDALRTKIETETKATRKKRKVGDAPSKEMEDFVADDDGDYDDPDTGLPKTPSKRRKHDPSTPVSRRWHIQGTTPQSKSKNTLTTPTHRRIINKKPLEFTPLGTRILPTPTSTTHHQQQTHPGLTTPHALARTRLHVSSVPTSLPCREPEFDTVHTLLTNAIFDGLGTCIYISGTPGTGKTATVREVVAALHAGVAQEELDDFVFVEINGMRLTDPHQAYSMLWEAVTGGDRVAPGHALQLLSHEFGRPSPRRVPVVVLMDELDQLVTRSQGVMYNFFNWPTLPHSRLIVLAVANTMDLPERTLSNKISSRLGLSRITFQGYSHTQLMKIIECRLEGAASFVDKDAIQFASRKVAQVSGDARRALDICRRAVEIAELEAAESAASEAKEEKEEEDGDADPMDLDPENLAPDTPSKRGRARPQHEKGQRARKDQQASSLAGQTNAKIGRVTIPTIQRAIREATASPLAQHLRALPLSAKLFLSALLAHGRRTGLLGGEARIGEILDEGRRIVAAGERAELRDALLVSKNGCGEGSGGRKGVERLEPRVLGMQSSVVMLVEAGVLAMEEGGRRLRERGARVRLQVGDEEVRGALKDDEDVKSMGLGFG
ncbi:MAG: Origin recognition complex, subunit 1 [Alyxoria varia]|nr:MAG: Origin recognition complex, subunit 1 [Alyxoria varia]